jgi:hypothetical protein
MQSERAVGVRISGVLYAAALTFALAASPLAAQPVPVVVTATKEPSEGALARANWYVARAEALDVGQNREGYLMQARLYRTAAELRGDDSASVTEFRMAAWTYYAGGDSTVALRMMTRAAQLADNLGDVERAVDSYLNAALIAQSGGRHAELVASLRQADGLLASPRFAAERRVALRKHIAAQPMFASLLTH